MPNGSYSLEEAAAKRSMLRFASLRFALPARLAAGADNTGSIAYSIATGLRSPFPIFGTNSPTARGAAAFPSRARYVDPLDVGYCFFLSKTLALLISQIPGDPRMSGCGTKCECRLVRVTTVIE